MNPSPHLILTLGRSGSNFLVNAINEAPRALNYGEVLGSWTLPRRVLAHPLLRGHEADLGGYVDDLYDRSSYYHALLAGRNVLRAGRRRPLDWPARSSLATIGTKDFAVAYRDAGIPSYAADRADLRVVGLARTNLVRRFVSGAFMSATRIVAAVGEDVALPTILVDPDELLGAVDLYAGELAELRSQLAAVPDERRLDLTYEDVFASPGDTRRALARLFDFLGLVYRGEMSDHRKLVVRPLNDLIANYDELRERLTGTPYLEQLEAPDAGVPPPAARPLLRRVA